MHYTLIRPLGWNFLSALASAEMEVIDERLTACLHEGGGSWAPTAIIAIGGAFGLSISAPLVVTGLADLSNVDVMKMATTMRVTYTSRSIVRKQDLLSGQGTNWAKEDGGELTAPFWESQSAGNSYLWIRLKVPVGAVLTSCQVVLQGADLHSGIPASPEVSIRRTINALTTAAIAGAVTGGVDAPAFSGVIGDYQLPFAMVATANHTRVAGETLWCRIKNESGGDALAGLKVYEVETTCTITSQDEHET